MEYHDYRASVRTDLFALAGGSCLSGRRRFGKAGAKPRILIDSINQSAIDTWHSKPYGSVTETASWAGNAFVGTAYHLPFPSEFLEKVICTGVLMHVGDELAALKEMVRVLQPNGLLVCSMNNALSPFSVPVRLKNYRKNIFILNFRLPGTYRRYLRVLGLRLLRVAGNGLFATVPLTIGRFCFPPKHTFPLVRSLDQWAVQRFAWLPYDVWFMATKDTSSCRS